MELLQPLTIYGPLGIFAAIFVWMYMKKDAQVETVRSECHNELKDIYREVRELVKEVSKALQDKSASDHQLSDAIEKLADKIEEIRR